MQIDWPPVGDGEAEPGEGWLGDLPHAKAKDLRLPERFRPQRVRDAGGDDGNGGLRASLSRCHRSAAVREKQRRRRRRRREHHALN